MQNINTLSVYLGSSGLCREIFKDTAKKMGQMIGQSKIELVYGGMDSGLMGIVANAGLEHGAHVTGIIPKSLKDSERIHPDLHETILVPDLWERKLLMFQRADAVVVLPGGFGTIDEALEVLYWADLSMHKKPVVFVNIDGYWDDFLAYIKTLPDFRAQYCLVAKDVDQVIPKLEAWPLPSLVLRKEPNYPHFEDSILGSTQNLVIDSASIKNSYLLATALGLKQLGKHNRPMGILNEKGQFDLLLKWVKLAQDEHFITPKCTNLFSVAKTLAELENTLKVQEEQKINLHTEKWGPSETKTHIEVVEKD